MATRRCSSATPFCAAPGKAAGWTWRRPRSPRASHPDRDGGDPAAMKLGFLTAPLPDLPLMDIADWAAQSGFESIEIACWPPSGGVKRKYAGTSHIDVTDLSREQAGEIRSEIEAKGLAISGLGFYPNPLHPDPAVRQPAIDHLKLVIEAAG